MHFLIVKNAYQTKRTPSLTPHHHPWIYWAYFMQIVPPGWPGISQDDSNEVLKSIEKKGLVRWLKYSQIARHWPGGAPQAFCSDKKQICITKQPSLAKVKTAKHSLSMCIPRYLWDLSMDWDMIWPRNVDFYIPWIWPTLDLTKFAYSMVPRFIHTSAVNSVFFC